MEIKTEIVNRKKKIIITRAASGEDKVREAILLVMGKGWEYKE